MGAERLHERAVDLPPELYHLQGHGTSRPQCGHRLGVVDHDGQSSRGLGHHLLPEKRAPEALDEVQLGIDLIGAIDRQIEDGSLGQGGQRDAQVPGLASRPK